MRRWPPDPFDRPSVDDEIEALRAKLADLRGYEATVTARQAALVVDLIWTVRRITLRPGAFGPAEGRPPTIGQAKAQGVVGLSVHCEGLFEGFRCWSARDLRWADLPTLSDEWVFVELPRRLRFRCLRCGGRKVSVRAVYPKVGPGGLPL